MFRFLIYWSAAHLYVIVSSDIVYCQLTTVHDFRLSSECRQYYLESVFICHIRATLSATSLDYACNFCGSGRKKIRELRQIEIVGLFLRMTEKLVTDDCSLLSNQIEHPISCHIQISYQVHFFHARIDIYYKIV